MKKQSFTRISKRTALAVAVAGAMFGSHTVVAQDAGANDDAVVEVILVSGIRSSLKASMDDKKNANVVSDGIKAEDLGKFPDLNVAESLQRITGVSIDRSGGEGQAVTVRGFGPQFNTVLLNGRQLATDSSGREFNFDVIAADQIVGADVYKSTNAKMQEGGIGGTIGLITARPFDYGGFKAVGSVKGMYESLSEEIAPSASFLVSNTFADETMGILVAVSHQERDVQINQISTAGWRPNQTILNNRDGVLFTNAFIPRNWDQIVDNQERTRTNASLVFQYAPSDDLTITVDGFVSKFEVDSLVTDLASWFEPDRVGSGVIDENGTLTQFTQEIGLSAFGSGNPASDFVSTTRNSRDVTNTGFGINFDWEINEALNAEFDISTSSAENDRAGRDRFNVVGIINNYSFDGTGSIPTVQHDGFGNGSLPSDTLARLHYNEQGFAPTDEDEITEYKADFTYTSDSDVFETARFGLYHQTREKSQFQIFGNQCAFCGYFAEAPLDFIDFRPFRANNFFPGLIDTFYTYDGDAMVEFLANQGAPIVTSLQNNRYTINEDITSLYADFTFVYDLGDMPVSLNVGARYSETSIDVEAIQSFVTDVVRTSDETLFGNVFGPATNIVDGGSYSNLLPSVNLKLELTDDMVLRFSVYDSLTRPTMSQLSPATNFGEPRRGNLAAAGGNPGLKPFVSENWDISFEWYYGDANLFSFAFFNKEVDDFIVTLTGEETFTLSDRADQPGFICAGDLCGELDPNAPTTAPELVGLQEVYTVTRPQNSEAARVTGYEIGVTHLFDNGFGITANATVVDSDVALGADTTQSFALEGLGDSQNLVVFYEKDEYQARVAFNNRESFLRALDNGFNGEPINTETFGQWDVSASYEVNENLTVFFEGINVTEEELRQFGRFANQTYSIEDNGSRYSIGIRGSF